ncbi:MAG: hypothetical protein KUL82_04630 [Bdellovibrio sp.]|nr:hypothetical protein [Bdellovibrio sp.]
MRILKFILNRFLQRRPFFYGWEQKAFERRLEQNYRRVQNTCRLGKD